MEREKARNSKIQLADHRYLNSVSEITMGKIKLKAENIFKELFRHIL